MGRKGFHDIRCPYCDSEDIVPASHSYVALFECLDCDEYFSEEDLEVNRPFGRKIRKSDWDDGRDDD